MIEIELPKALNIYLDGESTVAVDGACTTVGDALRALGDRSPGLLDRVINERGEIRPHVNVFLGEENTRFLDGLRTRVTDGDRILILAAVSGG